MSRQIHCERVRQIFLFGWHGRTSWRGKMQQNILNIIYVSNKSINGKKTFYWCVDSFFVFGVCVCMLCFAIKMEWRQHRTTVCFYLLSPLCFYFTSFCNWGSFLRVRFGHFKSNKGIAFFESLLSLLSLLPLLLLLLSQFQERFEVFPFDCKMEIYGRQNCGGLVFVVG